MKGNLPITKASPEIVKAAAATAAIIIAKYLPAESRKARQRKDSTDRLTDGGRTLALLRRPRTWMDGEEE